MENPEENKSEEKKSYFIHWLLGGAVGVFISVTLLFLYINKWTLPTVNDENNTLSNLGTIGDYFGGLINPLLGFVSFCALLYTIRIQMKSLSKQSEELELTREELRATKEELARSAKAQEQSSAIFKQQQFETTFFSLLNYLKSSIDKLEHENSNIFEVRRLIEEDRFRNSTISINISMMAEKLREHNDIITSLLSIFDFIYKYDGNNEIYIKIVKSIFTQNALLALLILANRKVLIDILEKNSFFDNLDIKKGQFGSNKFLIYLLSTKNFSEKAFAENLARSRIITSSVYLEKKYSHKSL